METAIAVWPELNYAGWRETAATLQLWTQIVSSAYPEPAGFRDQSVTPGAHFDKTLGEFILRYDTVRTARNLTPCCWTFCHDVRGRGGDGRLGPR